MADWNVNDSTVKAGKDCNARARRVLKRAFVSERFGACVLQQIYDLVVHLCKRFAHIHTRVRRVHRSNETAARRYQVVSMSKIILVTVERGRSSSVLLPDIKSLFSAQ